MHVSCLRVERYCGERLVLNNLSFSVPTGKSCAITGPSGCGKSTLLHTLAGLELPQAGTITWNDTSISDLSGKKREKLRNEYCGLLLQEPIFDPHRSTLASALLPSLFHTIPDASKQAQELLNILGLSEHLAQSTASLSGGQRIRLAIARCLLNRPSLIIADEPTGSLDEQNARATWQSLLELTQGTTMIVATHDPEFAAACDIHIPLETFQPQRQEDAQVVQ